jgi:hypothetical protein
MSLPSSPAAETEIDRIKRDAPALVAWGIKHGYIRMPAAVPAHGHRPPPHKHAPDARAVDGLLPEHISVRVMSHGRRVIWRLIDTRTDAMLDRGWSRTAAIARASARDARERLILRIQAAT